MNKTVHMIVKFEKNWDPKNFFGGCFFFTPPFLFTPIYGTIWISWVSEEFLIEWFTFSQILIYTCKIEYPWAS